MKLRHLPAFLLLSLLSLSLLLSGCGGDKATPTAVAPAATVAQATAPTPEPPTPTPAASIQVLDAVFAHGLSEEMQPQDPGADFLPDETVYLSIKIKGRPKKGEVTAQFYWHEQLIAEANVDLGDVNSGVLFSIGENTYAGYTLTHEQAFPLSASYHATVLVDGQEVGDYPFHIVPPTEAIPTRISQVTLARDVDANYDPVDPTTIFAPTDTVYLVGHGDLGLDSWLQADWYVAGQLDEAGTRSLTLQENAPDTGFSFSFLPEGGWPTGEHSVILTVDDEEMGRYNFTVR